MDSGKLAANKHSLHSNLWISCTLVGCSSNGVQLFSIQSVKICSVVSACDAAVLVALYNYQSSIGFFVYYPCVVVDITRPMRLPES